MALLPHASGAFTTRSAQCARDFAFAPELFQQTNLYTPYNRLLHRGVFEPDDVRLLAAVYEKVLCTVGVVDRKDPRAELIAKKVVQLAQAGERDPECLKDLAIEELQQSRDIASNS
jgi:hypothetical protein